MIANFLLAGQSNIDEWVNNDNGAALETFRTEFINLNPAYTDVKFYDAARGGSAILKSSALLSAERRASDDPIFFHKLSQNYWFDETTGDLGPTFDLFDHRITNWVNSGIEFAGIIWGQGEADTHNVIPYNGDIYETGLSFVLDTLSELSQTKIIHIQALGDRAYYNPSLHAGTDQIRKIQIELARDNPNITLQTTIYDLELRDSVHLTSEGYDEAVTRMVKALSGQSISPQFSHASQTGSNQLTLQLDLAPDQSLEALDTADGFRIFDNGLEVQITSYSTTARGLVVFELANPVSLPAITYASADIAVGMSEGDYLVVSGGSSLPVFPFNVELTPSRVKISNSQDGTTIEGSNLSENLHGFSSNDWIYGGEGHDVIFGGEGIDRMFGGEGRDAFILQENSGLNVVYDFEVGSDRIYVQGFSLEELSVSTYKDTDLNIRTPDGSRMVLRNVAEADISSNDFYILGTENGEYLSGGVGQDNITAGAGNDVLFGGAATDRLIGGEGQDTFIFGLGSDLDIVYDFDVSTDIIGLSGIEQTSLLARTYKDTDLELYNTTGDRLVLRNIDISELGNLEFAEPPDQSNKNVIGTAGNDVLYGTSADEVFRGLSGTDRLYGGAGSDVFIFEPAGNLDIVYDFHSGEDAIGLEGMSFDQLNLNAYKDTDLEITSSESGRMVLRDIDITQIDAENFLIF